MKYKINHWKCFWNSYKILECSFFDALDNEVLGKILAYTLFYICSIIGFIVFVIVTLPFYIELKKQIKTAIHDNNLPKIQALLKNKYIKENKNVADKG